MLNLGIPVSQINMKDPFIAKLALNRYIDLSEVDKLKAEQYGPQLFNDISIKHLLDNSDENYLTSLFQQLPAKIFLNNLNTLTARWPKWTDIVASWSAPIIAQLDPKQAYQLFSEHFDLNSNPFNDFNKIYGIVESRKYLEGKDSKNISNKLIEKYLTLPEKEKMFFALEILELTWECNHPEFNNLLPQFLKTSSKKPEVQFMQEMAALSHLFVDSSSDFNFIVDHCDGFTKQKYTSISLFFKESCPLSDIDKAIESLKKNDFKEILPLIQICCSAISNSRLKDVLGNLLNEKNTIDNLDKKRKAIFYSFILGCSVTSLRKEKIVLENLSLKQIVEILSADIEAIPSFDIFVAFLKKKNKEEVVKLLIEALNNNIKKYGGSHLINAMGELKYDQFKIPLIQALYEKADYIFLAAENALLGYGDMAIDWLRGSFKNKKKGDHKAALSVITRIGGPKAVELIDDLFDDLWKEDKEKLLSAMESVPDERFIKRLEPYVNKGQFMIDRTYIVLNKLYKRDTPEINSLTEKLFQQEKERQDSINGQEQGGMSNMIKTYLDLALKCKNCGDQSVYRIKEIIVSHVENSKPFILDEITCANCSKISKFELTPQGFSELSGEVTRLNMIISKEEGMEEIKKSPIKFMNTVVKGKEMGVEEGIQALSDAIEKNPTNSENYINLGYIYQNIKKYSEAEKNYIKAIEFDPEYIEPYYFLGTIDCERNDLHSAFDWLQKGSKFIETAKYRKDFEVEKAEFGRYYADLFNDLQRQTRLNVPALHPGAFSGKSGRNDPCPCGSGKKYKKCCIK